MTRFLHGWGRATAVALMLLLAFSLFSQKTNAQELYYGSAIGRDEVVDKDVVLSGENVLLDGTVNGDVFVGGKTIVINGEINGSLFAVGDRVVINGHVAGSVYVAAVTLDVQAEAETDRSIYFLGVSLLTEKGSAIGRDLYAVSLGARLAGDVAGTTKVIVGLVEIARLVIDSVNQVTTGKPIAELYPAAAPTDPLVQANRLQVMTGAAVPLASPNFQDADSADDVSQSTATVEWAQERLRELITLLIIGGLALWLIPGKLQQWADKVHDRPIPAAGWGVIAYIVGFIGSLLLLLIVVAIGTSFAVATLWGLAFVFWGIALSGLWFAFSLFLLFVAFGSKIIVAYLIGQMLFKRFYPRAMAYKIVPLLVGLIIYVLLCGIPYLGWSISLIVTFIGLGGVWLVYNGRKPSAANESVTA